jgi:hypothetical protein
MGALMTRILRVPTAAAIVFASIAFLPEARADWKDMFSMSGNIQSDIRFIMDDWRGEKPGEGYEFEMNRNEVNLRLRVDPADRVQAVVDTRFRFFGFNKAASLPELIDRERLDPYSLQLTEAYVAVRGLPWSRMDIKIGRMVQIWGTADMFNPTDNLNSRDFSDPLSYVDKVPNNMIDLTIYPTDWMTIQAVWVPTFKPAQLPPSAVMGFALDYDANGCVSGFPAPPLDQPGQAALENMYGVLESQNLCLQSAPPQVKTVIPKNSMANSQAGLRSKFHFGPVDFSLSYYYGRFGFPVAYTATANIVGGNNLEYVAEIVYPRMQVLGVDFAYTSENPWVPGFQAEAALIFPEQVTFGMAAFADGQPYPLSGGSNTLAAVNVPSTPFVKATAGMDWSYRDWFYVNLMYVRGFFDEFNDRFGLHNYFVAATEFKFFDNELQIRLAGVLDCDDLSAVAYPQVTWIVAPSMEIIGGYMHFFGDTKPRDTFDYSTKSRFGQRAAGRNVAFLKGKVSW